MAENADLLRAVLADPYADEPRLAYAAWCDRQRDEATRARGEFIRLQLYLTNESFNNGVTDESDAETLRRLQWLTNDQREKELRAEFAAAWAHPLASIVSKYAFDRGFIAHVTLTGNDFLNHAEGLLQQAPILLVSLTGVRPLVKDLFAASPLAHLGALGLSSNGLTTNDLGYLTESYVASNLWWLDLGANQIDFDGVALLANARGLKKLRYVGLRGNPCDPMETIGVDGYTIMDARLPEEGEALEARYGYIPWLHYPTDSTADYPPNPLRPPPER